MRVNDFIDFVQAKFHVLDDRVAARPIAEAMTAANRTGTGDFEHGGLMYKITALWVHGCIAYDCNPATCYTDWTLTVLVKDA